MEIDITKIAKETFKDKKLIIEKQKNNRVKIKYKNLIGRTSNHLSDVTLPNSIKLDVTFAEAIGLYLGDGVTSENNPWAICYTSIDPDICKFMLDFFISKFRIPLEDIDLDIRYRFGSRKAIKKKWMCILNINRIDRIYKIKRCLSETLKIQINGIILRKMFQTIMKNSLNYISIDKDLRRGFLRGYFAAEGTISYYNKNTGTSVSSISFSYNKIKENWLRDFCMGCLKLEGINSRYEESKIKLGGKIVICNWCNFKKMWEIGIFDRCERKKKLFVSLVRKPKVYIYLRSNFIKSISKENGMTQEKTAEFLGSTQGNISEIIRGKRPFEITQLILLSKFLNKDIQLIKDNITLIQIYHSSTKLKPSNDFTNLLFESKLV